LDTTSQKVIQVLAAFNRPVSSAAVDFVLQQHIVGINSAPILERLVSMHFVRRESKRYSLHPVDQQYAFCRVPAGEFDKKVGQGARSRIWDQHALILRAADYFLEVRKPRTEWKKLEDLTAQLAEFDLRCAAGDYDTAANVLTDFDFDYLLLWGHYRLMIQMHEKVTGKINDPFLQMGNLNGLGLAYGSIGDARKSILYFEQCIPAAQEAKNRQAEGAFLGNLGSAYAALGDVNKAIEYYEQALGIAREIGERRNEGNHLGSLGNSYAALGEVNKSIEYYEQALVIAREIGDRRGE
jgi:tetratricopeptide (TPR) repeat protein